MKLLFYILCAALGALADVMFYIRLPALRWKLQPGQFMGIAGALNLIAALLLSRMFGETAYTATLFILLNGLLLMTVTDLKEGMVYDLNLCPLLLCGVFSAFCNPDGSWMAIMLLFFLLGGVLLVLGRRASAGLGMGDAKALACVCLYFSYGRLVQVLFLSLFFSLIVGGVWVVAAKKSIKAEIPFMPFLLAGVLAGLAVS